MDWSCRLLAKSIVCCHWGEKPERLLWGGSRLPSDIVCQIKPELVHLSRFASVGDAASFKVKRSSDWRLMADRF
jgi:hypothetical protein